MTSVFIESGKEYFSSNRAIERFKKDIRGNDVDTLDHSSYLKEGYCFKVEKDTTNIKVNVISELDDMKEQKRKELRQRLYNAKYNRSGEARRKLESVKRTVPDKLYKSYMNLLRTAGGSMPNIPSPDEVVNNVDKYRPQISAVMGALGSVSNDSKVSNSIKHYFNSLGNMLGIEPMTATPSTTPMVEQTTQQSANSDTEDEDMPELVNGTNS